MNQEIDLGCVIEELNGAMNGVCDNYETKVILNTDLSCLSLQFKGLIGKDVFACKRNISIMQIIRAVNPNGTVRYEMDMLRHDVDTAIKQSEASRSSNGSAFK